ncbi:MAG: hypothetical protein RR716_06865 [Christensenellaceae bacterium]
MKQIVLIVLAVLIFSATLISCGTPPSPINAATPEAFGSYKRRICIACNRR